MPSDPQDNLAVARRYLSLLEQNLRDPEIGSLFAPDFEHREYPNKLNPSGRTLGLAQLIANTEKAAQISLEQRYSIRKAIAAGDDVALEVDWTGRFNIAFGSTPAGQPLRAAFGMFLHFRDGRIASQHNYDCFEPF
ncbi:MAG TPA: nuclear transport factor 2 family protein [Polyangiales bacterium]|nr:nuclear transport factor 2 family protein [Polyangiales bacterium]